MDISRPPTSIPEKLEMDSDILDANTGELSDNTEFLVDKNFYNNFEDDFDDDDLN